MVAAVAAPVIHPLTWRGNHAFLCNIGDISHASSAKCSIAYNPDETAYRPQGTTLIPFVIRSPTYVISGSRLCLTLQQLLQCEKRERNAGRRIVCASRTSDLQPISSKSYLYFVFTSIQATCKRPLTSVEVRKTIIDTIS